MGLAWALGARRTHSSCTKPLYMNYLRGSLSFVLIKLCNKKPSRLLCGFYSQPPYNKQQQ